jgi:hypothetical protein
MTSYGDPREIGAYVMQSLGCLFTTEDHRESAQSSVAKREPRSKGQ